VHRAQRAARIALQESAPRAATIQLVHDSQRPLVNDRERPMVGNVLSKCGDDCNGRSKRVAFAAEQQVAARPLLDARERPAVGNISPSKHVSKAGPKLTPHQRLAGIRRGLQIAYEALPGAKTFDERDAIQANIDNMTAAELELETAIANGTAGNEFP
jgi:hypothetical protein